MGWSNEPEKPKPLVVPWDGQRFRPSVDMMLTAVAQYVRRKDELGPGFRLTGEALRIWSRDSMANRLQLIERLKMMGLSEAFDFEGE